MGKAKTLRSQAKQGVKVKIITIPTPAEAMSIGFQTKSLREWEAKLTDLWKSKAKLTSGLLNPTPEFLDEIYRQILDVESYEKCKAADVWPYPKEIIDWLIGIRHDEILEAKAKIKHLKALLRRMEEEVELRKYANNGGNDRGSGGAPGMVA